MIRRSEVRSRAFQFLYQIEIQTTGVEEQLAYFLRQAGEDPLWGEEELAYCEHLIRGVIAQRQELDAIIEKHLRKWTLDRLPKVDLSILRLAIYEIQQKEIPFSIVVSEAVNLAHRFAQEDAYIYINGLLAQLDPEESNE